MPPIPELLTPGLFWEPPPNPKPEFEPNPGLLKKRIADRLAAYPATEQELKALRYARGIYQRALILGIVSWSDASLGSKVKIFKRRYGRSREHLLQRLLAAGVAYLSCDGQYGTYHLVYGHPRDDMEMVYGKYHHVWRKKKDK